MREQTLIRALEMHDQAINSLRAEFRSMQKIVDKTYLQSLTHVMMWDVLLGLLNDKGMITRQQFDDALKDLSERTKAAMDAEVARKKMETEGKTTVLSETAAIPVTK